MSNVLKKCNYLVVMAGILLFGCAYESDFDKGKSKGPSKIRINEVATNNCTGIYDEFGNTTNWIELYNQSQERVKLSEYYLSDNRENPLKWQLGERFLEAGAYELLFTSGRDIRDTGEVPEPIVVDMEYVYTIVDSVDGGLSFIRPFEFDSLIEHFEYKKPAEVSAKLYLGDNISTIEWKGQCILNVKIETIHDSIGKPYVNLEQYNQIELEGYFEKGKEFYLGFALHPWIVHDTTEHANLFYSGLSVPFVGTGEPNGVYKIQINRSEHDELVDMRELRMLRIENRTVDDSMAFTLKQVRFSSTAGNFHTGFRLSELGDELYLSNATGEVVDSILIPSLRSDISYGVNDNGVHAYFNTGTPGSKNSEIAYNDTAEILVFPTAGGFFAGSKTVVLQTVPGSDVRYTLDGSEPTLQSEKYTAPFTIDSTTVVRAAAFKDSALTSVIRTETYFIDEQTKMPVISITVDPDEMFDSTTGMYMAGPNASPDFPHFGGNFWDKERMLDGHIEFYEPSRNRAFSRTFGLKIHGGWSRGEDKKSLALMFKEQYDEGPLEYPIFPEYPNARRFKSLILRTGGGHFKDVMIYDGFNGSLLKERNIEYQKLRSVKLFINGVYWGLYNIREKLNEHYFDTNFGYDGSEINMIKDNGIVQQGSVTDYVTLLNYLRLNDVSTPRHYTNVATMMDVDNYIDYMASEMFFANNDWPANNIKWWKTNRTNSKWRWVLYDTDGTVKDSTKARVEWNMIAHCTNDKGKKDAYPNGADFTFLFRDLLTNSTFRARFINRTMTLLNTTFDSDRYSEKLDYLLSFIGDEYIRDFNRWNLDITKWSAMYSEMKDFGERRASFMRTHFKDHFPLEEPVQISLKSQKGSVVVDGMSLGGNLDNGYYFPDVSLSLTVSDTTGFTQWNDGSTLPVRTVSPEAGLSLEAQFQ